MPRLRGRAGETGAGVCVGSIFRSVLLARCGSRCCNRGGFPLDPPMIRVPRRVSSCLVAGLAFGLLALPAMAARIYQWKDARGVTHYTDLPPPNQGHTTREVGQKSAAPTKPAVNAEI